MASIRIPFLFTEYQSAKEAGFDILRCDNNMMDILSNDVSALQAWKDANHISVPLEPHRMKPRFKPCSADVSLLSHSTNTPYFTMTQLRSIYNLPSPKSGPYVVGIVSFGGGLYGTVDSQGVLTNGDIQTYWTSIGITPANHPRVIVVPINGATNIPSMDDSGSTIENTIDVETVGGACPSSNLTIILYIAPNAFNQFAPMLQYIYSTNITVNGVNYKPNLISCSWGAPELYYSPQYIAAIHSALTTLSNAGISVCVATGDHGSNNGVGGTGAYVDFPSANPYSTAVGGSRLVCPNNIYDSSTVETGWTSGGGGMSAIYTKPDYQSSLTGTKRSIPDVACVADPATGVYFIINSSIHVIGGTSVSAPIFAGFLATIHCTTFINPLLYQIAMTPSNGAFHDLTNGSNGAYSAHAGYDVCTGWGSFDGVRLATAIHAIQQPILPPPIQVSGINLSSTSLSLQTYQSFQISASIVPNNATNPTITWTSSNALIATVSSTGLISAFQSGTAIISARSTDGSNIVSSITVSVTSLSVIPVSGISINPTNATLNVGSSLTLTPTILPSNATNKTIVWSSTRPTVASISSSGVITAVAPGSATIKALTISGSFSASCVITVIIPVASVSISPSTVIMGVGTTRQLTETLSPSNATNKGVVWSSSNINVAIVNSFGLITSRTSGTCTISVKTIDGNYIATTQVSVAPRMNNVRLNRSTLTLPVNGTFQLDAIISPFSASIQRVLWSSSRKSVATVSSTGLITAKSYGTTTISVTTEDGNPTASVVVRVSSA